MMKTTTLFSWKSRFDCSVAELYNWHARPGALERLIPPWEDTWVLERNREGISPGTRARLRVHFGPIPLSWHALHLSDEPGRSFCDEQSRGPFAFWRHQHLFTDSGDGGSILEDRIEYRMRFHGFMPAVMKKHLRQRLENTFVSRHATLAADLAVHRRCSNQSLRFLVSGAGGVLGRELLPFLTTGGHEVWRLVRRVPRADSREIYWDPAQGEIDIEGLPEIDGIIHLAGENIAQGRWTEEKKRIIIDSRVKGTFLLARTAASMPVKPKVFVSASAIGCYGNAGSQWVAEEQAYGGDFISEVCQRWEEAVRPAAEAGIRSPLLRIGVVLTPKGGALHQLRLALRFGIGRLGSGEQYVSWISLDDMISAILHAAVCPELHGPVNVAAPQPVTNRELMAAMADCLAVRAPLTVPSWLLRAWFGEMADQAILAGCRVRA
ncbi:MAG: TIGR01777 family oxidoreductase, partial [Proteobacteria bacterium]|nr:TIGR01777 family oxidoreductase [Pseudomonadota bacterium]